MNYASCNQYIDHIIIGVENSKQLIQNIEQLDNSLGLPIKKFNFPEKILDPLNWLNLIDD
jgi:predicted HTH transcriptional regulator